MVLKLIIEITFVLFIVFVFALLVCLRRYIRLLNKEIDLMAENMKSLSDLEGMNMELLKHLWELFDGVEVQKVENNENDDIDLCRDSSEQDTGNNNG